MSRVPDEVVASKAWDTAIFRRLARYARPHMRLFIWSFALTLVLFAFELAGPWMLKAAIDGPIQAAQQALGSSSDSNAGEVDTSPYLIQLGWLALAYFVVVCLQAACNGYQVRQLTKAGQTVIHDLRTELFGHMQKLDLAWFDRRPTGALVTRVTSDVENLSELFTSGLIVLAFDFIKIAVVLGLLFWVSPPLALLVLVSTPLLIGVSLVFRGGARRAHRHVRARLARLNGFLQEILSGVRVVQVFGREERVARRFSQDLAAYLQANLRTIFLFALFFPIITFVVTGIQGGIVWRGGAWIAAGELSFGDFILFWWWFQKLVGPIRELGERYNVLQSAFASAERIFEVLDTRPSITAPAQPKALPQPFRGHVRFENVAFAYTNDGPPVIEEIEFEIPSGHTVALVGATGSGKSTLVNLLLRYYDPRSGRVTVDGIDLREADLAAYRSKLGVVLQEDFLFSGTIRDNLVLGRAGVSPASLRDALDASAAADLVRRLPQGLETPVAERGATLSSGERELLSIARSLAANPELVILDEATSSVDSATEARIEAATHNLLQDRSALVVAHRLSTVRRADNILVMHHGRIREMGNHEELLTQGGIYARLYALQFRDPDDTFAAV